MKNKFISIIFLAALTAFAASVSPLESKEFDVRENVAVFAVTTGNIQLDSIADKSADRIRSVFAKLGRFIPAEQGRIKYAFDNITYSDEGDIFRDAAEILEVDIYIVVNSSFDGSKFYGRAEIFPVKKEYSRVKKVFTAESTIAVNIPPKLEKEIALMHRGLPLRADIGCNELGCEISAGQWHGLREGKYASSAGEIEITAVSRYFSRANYAVQKDAAIEIKIYPDAIAAAAEAEREIEINTLMRYGMKGNKSGTAEQRFAESVCIINPGANVCLPAYGSFLALSYLGLPDSDASIPGLAAGGVLLAGQFFYVPAATSFSGNFFPWVKDSDKSTAMSDMHVYLWSALPFTITAVYLDQMSYRLDRVNTLPPFFEERDNAAALFSFLIPGAGLFYKGHRAAGWFAFFAETAIGVYAADNYRDDTKFNFALAGLLAVKGGSVITSYLIGSGYEIFNRETAISGDTSFGIAYLPYSRTYALSLNFFF